jgi:CRP-like cAMP-binding protein
METSQLHDLLREIQFTAQMGESALRRLAEVAALKQYSGGTVLFREGSHNGDLFLLRSGRVTLEMNVPGRGKLAILTLGPGDMVAWSALLGSGEMTCTAVTLDNVEAIVASGAKLLELCEQGHEFGYHLMRRMAAALSRRLLATRLQLLDLFADTPPAIRTGISAEGATKT